MGNQWSLLPPPFPNNYSAPCCTWALGLCIPDFVYKYTNTNTIIELYKKKYNYTNTITAVYLACTYALGRVLRKKLLSPNSLVLIDRGNQGITICSIFYTSFHILLKAKNIQSNDFTRKDLIYGGKMWRRPSTLPTTTHAS